MKNYETPEVEKVCEIKAEAVFAAQSWNPGQGKDPGKENKRNWNQGKGNKMDIFSLLCQKIGVFYLDKKWKNKIFEQTIDYCRSIDLIFYYTEYSIHLKGGTVIDFYNVNNESCFLGRRLNRAVVQDGVADEIVKEHVMPLLVFTGVKNNIFFGDENGIYIKN